MAQLQDGNKDGHLKRMESGDDHRLFLGLSLERSNSVAQGQVATGS